MTLPEMPRKRQSRAATSPPLPPVSMELALDNNDLLMHILLLLPAKSLIRFKSVCKKWLSLISSHQFCHQHTLHRHKLQQSLIIQMDSLQFFYLNQTIDGKKVMIPYTLSVRHHQILQDCNGLLLLEYKRHKDYNYVYNPTSGQLERRHPTLENCYYVYNPTTRRSRKIIVTNNDMFSDIVAITLAFDPSKSPYYKVVCVRSTPRAYRIEVYDSESHTWRLSLKPYPFPRINNDGVHWNNSIIWSIRDRGDGDVYCCFDIAKNEIKSLSSSTTRPRPDVYLQESNGHLYSVELILKNANTKITVLELGGDDHSEWLPKYHSVIYGHYLSHVRHIRIVAGWGGDGATCSLLTYETLPERMAAYNFLNNSYKRLLCFTGQPISEYGGVMKGFQFGETLALV